MKKIIFTLLGIGLLTLMFAQSVQIEMRPAQVDISSATSESAVLVTIGGYPTSQVRYRLYSGTNQHNCWDGTQYVTSNVYANNPQVPGDPSTSTTWWILYQRGTITTTAANYRDRLGPDYSSNYQTQALPAAGEITSPIDVTGVIPNAGSHNLNVKYAVLGFDSTVGGNFIVAGSTELNTGNFTLGVQAGVTIRRIEFRTITNSTAETMTGEWPPEDAVATPTFTPPGGSYYGSVMVTISTSTPGATIHYTLNGDDPTEASPIFTDPIEVTESMTIKARGYATGLDPSMISTANYTIITPVDVDNIAELRGSPQDGTVYRLVNQVVLTYQQSFRHQKFVQDVTGGILIDDDPGVISTTYAIRDGISGLTGTISTYGNMLQFVPVQDPGPASAHNVVVTPVVITMDDFVNDMDTYQSRLVKIENVYFTTADGSATFANGQVYPLSDGTNTIDFRTTFYDVDYIGEVIPTETIDLTGIPNSRAEGHFITSRDNNDLYSYTSVETHLIQPLRLLGNYPNPFNPSTIIHFSVPVESELQLVIYNIKGQVVRELVNTYLPAGEHRIEWDGRDDANRIQASGVYFYKLQTADQTLIRKALMIK